MFLLTDSNISEIFYFLTKRRRIKIEKSRQQARKWIGNGKNLYSCSNLTHKFSFIIIEAKSELISLFDVLILNRKPKSLVEFLAYHWKNIGDKITRANNNWKGEVFSKKRACATRAENRLYNYNRFWQKKNAITAVRFPTFIFCVFY